jgi:hyperosmotically inducible protein
MRIWLIALAAASAVCAALAVAADPVPATHSAGEAKQSKESKAPADYVEDGVITARVKTALLSERSIPAVDISVETNRSEVALSGKVQNDQQRRTAVQIASAVQGVARVKNDLTLRSESREAPRP